jgi:chromosomal replication initiation ATPase DnaA
LSPDLDTYPVSSAARFVAEMVAFALGLDPEAVVGRARSSPRVAAARQVVMYLLGAGFGLSQGRVALALGRDRSTIAHALRVVEERREDPVFDAWLTDMEATLQKAPDWVRPEAVGARSAS